MEIKIDLAGIILRITGADSEIFREPGILRPFLTDAETVRREVTCGIVDALPEPRGDCVYHDASRWVYRDGDAVVSYLGAVGNDPELAYIRAERREDSTDVRVKRDALLDHIPPKTVLYALETEHLVVENGGFLLHCAYVSDQGGAILFTAPSGVGKSTQAELWRRHRGAEVINGDRAVVRLRDGKPEAWGVPFSGSSGISKYACLPLRAIVYLSQAPETTIRPLTGVRAFRRVWEGCSLHTWDRDDVARCSDTVMQTIGQVPVFHLACTPDESAVLALEAELNKIQR